MLSVLKCCLGSEKVHYSWVCLQPLDRRTETRAGRVWPLLTALTLEKDKTDGRMDWWMDNVSLASFPDILISLVLLRYSIADGAALVTNVTPKQCRQTSLQWSLQLRYSSRWSLLPWWCQTSAVASESHTDNLDHSGLDSLSLLKACSVSLYVPDRCVRFWIWYRDFRFS